MDEHISPIGYIPIGLQMENNCKNNSNERNPPPINVLYTTGKVLFKAHVLANGIEVVVLIETGAALTAVSEYFANNETKAECKWTGPSIYLANGLPIEPKTWIQFAP